ncbi:MarR family winged helix-turn-helix transcriptional regulator [Streptomyces sp. NBC_01217]|uniref:MarR family winged helix-turn-helix transcriptional regulator n=1 Tax=Streptomyces sp. NBC_01217 TaxID=2903779 RepID=UPI002E14A46F|nr:MarR family transcriptional regulator [Streptomyces sp. NBC_01217]
MADGTRAESAEGCPTAQDAALLLQWHTVQSGLRRLNDQLLADVKRASHAASSSLQVLWYLLTVPEHAAPMNQLSQLMGFSTAGTTKVVDRLSEAGLLERRPSRSDRRVTYAALTPAGLAAASDASSALAAALRRRVAAAGVGTDRFAALAADIALLDPAPGPCTAGPGPECPGARADTGPGPCQ